MSETDKSPRMSAASAVVRNPLSVIAMFVVLVETISTVTLDRVVSSYYIAIPLVYFCVLFPTLVAVLFFVTLWWKHQFLYSPMEYRTDEAFLSAMARLNRVEARQEASDLNPNTASENQSISVITRLLALDDVRAAVKVGRTFLDAKQYDIAERLFSFIMRETRQDHNDMYNAVSNLGYAEIGLGKFKEAAQHLEDAIGLAGPSRAGPWHYVALAYAYFKQSNAEKDDFQIRYKSALDHAKSMSYYSYNKKLFRSLYPDIQDNI